MAGYILDSEGALDDVRAVACALNHMSADDMTGVWYDDPKLHALLARVLLEAVDVLEAADKAEARA